MITLSDREGYEGCKRLLLLREIKRIFEGLDKWQVAYTILIFPIIYIVTFLLFIMLWYSLRSEEAK